MARKKLVLANNPLLSGPDLEERSKIGIPYQEVKLSAVERDQNQPRVNFNDEQLRELADSIRTYGVLTPILVRPGKLPNRYALIAGERRVRAAKMAGLATIPAMVTHDHDETGERTLAIQLVENLQRADLTPIERAHAISALKETHNLSIREVAERLGVSKSMVQRSLEILELPDDLLNALREGASESKILLLAKIEDPEIRSSYLKDIDVLTRNKLKKDIEKKAANKDKVKGVHGLSPEDNRIVDEIQRALGLKVSMIRSATNPDNGKLNIEFYSDSDLQEVFRKLIAEA